MSRIDSRASCLEFLIGEHLFSPAPTLHSFLFLLSKFSRRQFLLLFLLLRKDKRRRRIFEVFCFVRKGVQIRRKQHVTERKK